MSLSYPLHRIPQQYRKNAVGGQKEWKVPTKPRRNLETEKLDRKLHIINGLIFYRVTHRVRLDRQQSGLTAVIHTAEWLLAQFTINLGYWGTCLETWSALLSQDL